MVQHERTFIAHFKHSTVAPPYFFSSADHINTISTMSYKTGIITAITELKDRTGSSSIAIKKHMQDNLPADKKWMNGMFLKALKDGVAAGDFVKVKASYKLSAASKTAAKKKAAPKKKVRSD